ncbi:MAG: hypothetical protein K8S87_11675, partial [Planctomycetes bacterium]|nr:hypothetical protein [Planctomycetota bacterium]
MNTQNSRLFRRQTYLIALFIACLLIISDSNTTHAKDKKKKYKRGNLLWGIADSVVIAYKGQNFVQRVDMNAKALRKKEEYHKDSYKPPKFAFYGYQFEGGELAHKIEKWGVTGSYPNSITDLIERICFTLPGVKARSNKKYMYEKKFYISNPSSVINVSGHWKTDKIPRDVNEKIKIFGKFLLNPVKKDEKDKYFPPRISKLEEGLVLTETVFNQEFGYIESVKVKFRYWYAWTKPTEPEKPQFNNNGRWEQFEITKTNMIDISVKTPLKNQITRAINMSIEALKRTQSIDGSWPYGVNHLAGSTSICALALLSSGIKPDDACINKAFEFLYKTPIKNIYDASLVCMVSEARGIPASEWKLSNKNKMPEKFDRKLSSEDRKLLKTALKFILTNRADKHPRTGIGLWDYPRENAKDNLRFDNSNSQFAVLGLYSAMRCGEKIDKQVFIDIAEQFMKTQEQKGPLVSLMLPKDNDKSKSKTKPKYHKYSVKARGWGYTITPNRPDYKLAKSSGYAYGSMTAAGITSLVIARAGLHQLDELKSSLKFRIRDSLHSAMAFFQTYYDITGNPNASGRRSWYYYYLYGIERVGMLMGTEYIGEHEWYPEGAAI